MKICLFGGTFDPPHLGHLLIAQTVCEAENFDRIIFIPALKPPHKNQKIITPVNLRLEMLESAVLDNPRFEISQMEIQRGGTSYSLDTIKQFKTEYQLTKGDIFFLIGSDTLGQFDSWNEPKKIVKECSVLVAVRPGFKPSTIPNWILHNIQFANIPRFEISSSNIRKRWKENKTIRYMVTLSVWDTINKYNLYSG
jgi:nicotinate-nucleotide adenylyltransferase